MLWQILERALASAAVDAVAARQARRVLGWKEFGAGARQFAALLSDLEPGERVAALQLNTIEHAQLTFGAAGAGVVLVPLNARLAPPEMAQIVRHSGARRLIADRSLAELARALLEELTSADGPLEVLWNDEVAAAFELEDEDALDDWEPAPVEPSDVAQLYYTSGSTGQPKGVQLTHENVATHAANAVVELDLAAGDVWGHFAPMFHLADAWATFAITAAGGTHAFLPSFRPDDALGVIEEHGVTISNLVPTMLRDLVAQQREAPRDVQSLRCLMSGGAPIARETVREILETFDCDYVQTYGMTETSPYLTLSLLHEHLRSLPFEQQLHYKAKTGRAFRGVELEVVTEDGQPVPCDGRAVGEIRVRGASVSPGYWRDEAATAEAFRAGWLWTGDLAVIDAEGYVDIVDRKKDMILTGGENVFCIEVENALYAQAGVREVAVFGVPDERWGEAVHAAVVLAPDATCTDAELLAGCRERLAGYKVPKVIRRLAALPRTGPGKIDKRALR